jgi:diadenosine tetraphosphate (Ap4A) HIT family hydrolase
LWYEDDKVAVFEDIKPGAALHGLIVPKRHIRDIDHLRYEDIELLEYMKIIANKILDERGFRESRLGFHQPPFNSMFHLHMHIVGLPLKNDFINKRKLNQALVSPDIVIERLQKK